MARIYWKGGNAGVEGSFTEGLTSKTLSVADAVDLGGGRVKIPVAHAGDFVEDDYVILDGTDYYDGDHRLVDIPDANNITIIWPYNSETFAGSDTAKSSNWVDDDGIPCAAPAAADDMILDENARIATNVSPLHTKGKRWNLISNIAVGDTGGLELANLIVRQGYDGKIGIDAQNAISPLHVSIADNGCILYQSNSEAYIECSADDAVTDINIPLLVFDTSAGYLRISSDVNSGDWTSLWNEIRCLNRGVLELDDDTACQTIRTYDSNVTLIVGTSCIDVKDTDDPIDLYISSEEVYAPIEAGNRITTTGVVNFGTAALTLIKGR